MSNLPPAVYDRTVIVEPNINNPDRAPLAGTGRDFVVSLNPDTVVGRDKMFLASDGTWVPFASTELNAWGAIIGTITDQADLMAMFGLYTKTTDFPPVALSGSYTDLTNKPPLGTVAPINLNGQTSYFLRGDGTWQIPVDVGATWGNISGNINAQADLVAAFALKAPLSNPVFTGSPSGPTPPLDDDSTRFATTTWFFGQAFNGVPVMDGAASSGASTLWARGDHRHPTDTTLAPLDSPQFTGIPIAPTPVTGNVSQRLATTAFVAAAITAAGLTPPPSDGNTYAMKNGVWVVLDLGSKWDKA